jgi:hypothetical protein
MQYACYDSSVSGPSPVIGWFDTSALLYPNLPPRDNLLSMTQSQWDARLTGLWAVSGGVLVAYTPPTPVLTLAQQANIAINAGLTITSTDPTLNLNAIMFPVDIATTTKIGLVVTTLTATSAFPGGSTTFPMKDSSGNWHTLAVPQYLKIAGTISTYVTALNLIVDGNPFNVTTLPTNNVIITE